YSSPGASRPRRAMGPLRLLHDAYRALRLDGADAEARRRASVTARSRIGALARARSRFYQTLRYAALDRLADDHDAAAFERAWTDVPVLSKRDLVEDFDALVVDPELTRARVRAFDEENPDGG